jgi:hypothetical protein
VLYEESEASKYLGGIRGPIFGVSEGPLLKVRLTVSVWHEKRHLISQIFNVPHGLGHSTLEPLFRPSRDSQLELEICKVWIWHPVESPP